MKQEIYNTLDRLGIDYTRLEHPSIMTMEEGMTVVQKLGVSPCKNLFLVNKQKEYFLLLLSGNKKLSAKSIAKQIGSSHLSFACAITFLADSFFYFPKVEAKSTLSVC